ncbi:LysM peptidoglycan-binding domain-containing protein [Paenibacillus donghaensis]|uniref:LysM domain-containing protein n=1 Tax=Paenibacillus donghaensis TaxID=414771 RepID=A0A2Z2KSX2_9BACL|nr:LysM peptidoglycan-binding domain-containing protein [Paenibacillus donghaensis]ASA23781.1 hypothetical protein B9T62_25160 [Paenibacillus donghaensis]
MFDQSHGLRFDIYERIHLSEELPGIAELEEVELIPDIQVIQREDRAELYGQLLLTGLYRSEEDRTQRLEHAIPVEITVPLTRVSSLEDIGVEIENFDIDLLTMRTVNITGVLSLRGIGGTEVQPGRQQEEYTAAYTPAEEERVLEAGVDPVKDESEKLYENFVWTYGEGTAESLSDEREHGGIPADPLVLGGIVNAGPAVHISSAQSKEKEQEPRLRTHSLDNHSGNAKAELTDYWNKTEQWNQPPQTAQDSQETAKGQTIPAAVPAAIEQEQPQPLAQAVQPVQEEIVDNFTASRESADIAAVHAVQQEETFYSAEAEEANVEFTQENVSSPLANEPLAGDNFSAQEVLPAEEKQDLKIALGSKREEELQVQEPLTFSSLLSSSRSRKEQQDTLLTEETAAVAAVVSEVGNDTEWKTRFIAGAEGTNLFRKVRLCIVQREETLDTIAEKYQLSARELVMYNRLAGQNVEEGQVLYIP